jgi:hypothetical protein
MEREKVNESLKKLELMREWY